MTLVARWAAARRAAHLDRHVVALLGVLAFAAGVRFRNIGASLPYSEHNDERTIVTLALRMLEKGDPNPHRFNYPSLPVYLILAGMVSGGLVAIALGQAKSLGELWRFRPRYYPVVLAAWATKALFAGMSVLALALVGFIACAVTRRRVALWLAPLIASLASLYLRLSWQYLNVDIIGAFFAMVTVAILFVDRKPEAGRFSRFVQGFRPILAGGFAGLTISSKYNLFPILLPCVLWFWLYERERFTRQFFFVALAATVAFLVTTPYAILSHREFLYGTWAEIRHYAQGTGDAETTEDRGWPMLLVHIEHFATTYGWWPLLAACVGAGFLFKNDARQASILFSYPVGLVLFMSAQRVFFERNVVCVHLFIAIAIAASILSISEALLARISEAAGRFPWLRRIPGSSQLALVFIVALVLVGVPWKGVRWAYGPDVEPRNDVARWLNDHVKPGAKIIVDEGLHLDRRTLDPAFRIQTVDGAKDVVAAGQAAAVVRGLLVHRFTEALPGSRVEEVFKRIVKHSRDRKYDVAVLVIEPGG